MNDHKKCNCEMCDKYFSIGYNPHPHCAYLGNKKLYFCSKECVDKYVKTVKGATR